MKRLQLFIAVMAVSCNALVPHAWGVTLDEWPFQCQLYFRQAQFTETTANYDFFGACGLAKDTSLSWTFNAKAAYTDGKPVGKAHEHYIFNSQQAANCGSAWIVLVIPGSTVVFVTAIHSE